MSVRPRRVQHANSNDERSRQSSPDCRTDGYGRGSVAPVLPEPADTLLSRRTWRTSVATLGDLVDRSGQLRHRKAQKSGAAHLPDAAIADFVSRRSWRWCHRIRGPRKPLRSFIPISRMRWPADRCCNRRAEVYVRRRLPRPELRFGWSLRKRTLRHEDQSSSSAHVRPLRRRLRRVACACNRTTSFSAPQSAIGIGRSIASNSADRARLRSSSSSIRLGDGDSINVSSPGTYEDSNIVA